MIEIEEPKFNKITLDPGTYTTNCILCNVTCHYPCNIPDDDGKRDCTAMVQDNCTVCKDKCHWNNHRNMQFIWSIELIKKQDKAENIYAAYIDATSKLSTSEQVMAGLNIELELCEIECVTI